MCSVPIEISVRDAVPADAVRIADFNIRLAAETEGRDLLAEVVRGGVERGLARPDCCRYFVAEIDACVVGQAMITFEWSDWRDGMLWWLQSVYVEAEHRGRGVFRALLGHIEQRARSSVDVVGLRLYVDEHNAAARATYDRLGFGPSGHLVYERQFSPTDRQAMR